MYPPLLHRRLIRVKCAAWACAMPPSANVAQAVVPKLRQLHADGFCIVIFTNQARRGVAVRPS